MTLDVTDCYVTTFLHLKQSSCSTVELFNRHLGQECRSVCRTPKLSVGVSNIRQLSKFDNSDFCVKIWTVDIWKYSSSSDEVLNMSKVSLCSKVWAERSKMRSSCFESFEPNSSDSRSALFTAVLTVCNFSNFPAKLTSRQRLLPVIEFSVGMISSDVTWLDISATNNGVIGDNVDLKKISLDHFKKQLSNQMKNLRIGNN